MKIQILGPGCKRCDQLYANTLKAIDRCSNPPEPLEAEKVKDLDVLYRLGIFVTPGFVIDGQVISAGKLLSPDQIETEIRNKLKS